MGARLQPIPHFPAGDQGEGRASGPRRCLCPRHSRCWRGGQKAPERSGKGTPLGNGPCPQAEARLSREWAGVGEQKPEWAPRWPHPRALGGREGPRPASAAAAAPPTPLGLASWAQRVISRNWSLLGPDLPQNERWRLESARSRGEKPILWASDLGGLASPSPPAGMGSDPEEAIPCPPPRSSPAHPCAHNLEDTDLQKRATQGSPEGPQACSPPGWEPCSRSHGKEQNRGSLSRACLGSPFPSCCQPPDPWGHCSQTSSQGTGCPPDQVRGAGGGACPCAQATTHLAPSPPEREGGLCGTLLLERYQLASSVRSHTWDRGAGHRRLLSVAPARGTPCFPRGTPAGRFFLGLGVPKSQTLPSGHQVNQTQKESSPPGVACNLALLDLSGHPLRSWSVEAAGRHGNMNNV